MGKVIDNRSYQYGTFANISNGILTNPTTTTATTITATTTFADASGIINIDTATTTPSMTAMATTSKTGDADVTLTDAIQQEHALSFWQAVKLYPKAVGWSAFVSMGVIMLAFDPQIIGNMYAMPQFQKDFGVELDGDVCIIYIPTCLLLTYTYPT